MMITKNFKRETAGVGASKVMVEIGLQLLDLLSSHLLMILRSFSMER